MSALHDTAIITFSSLLSSVANLIWTWKLHSIQTHGEIIRDLQEQLSAKEELLHMQEKQLRDLKQTHHETLYKHLYKKAD